MSSRRARLQRSKSKLKLTDRLAQLKAERERRSRLKKAVQPAETKPKEAEAEWRQARQKWSAAVSAGYDPPAGEIINVAEGLTPKGKDRRGRQVSFVEYGQPVSIRRFSEPRADRRRMSSERLDRFGQ